MRTMFFTVTEIVTHIEQGEAAMNPVCWNVIGNIHRNTRSINVDIYYVHNVHDNVNIYTCIS